MQVAVLAGGLGTRLRPFTVSLPKPLLPVGSHAILEIILLQLASQGFTRATLCTGYHSHLIRAVVGDGSALGIDVDYVVESGPTGTAGALREIGPVADGLLVMNGDLLTQFDFRQIVCDHMSSGHDASVVTTPRRTTLDYGIVEVSPEGTLAHWSEKPTLEHMVSTGVYVLGPRALQLVPEVERFDMPDLFRAVMSSGGSVGVLTTDDYWQDIGRMEDYAQACEDVEADPQRFLLPRAHEQ